MKYHSLYLYVLAGSALASFSLISDVHADPFSFWIEDEELSASNLQDGAEYGGAIAVNDSYLLISAREENAGTTSIDDTNTDEGVVYVYDVSTLEELFVLVADDATVDDEFGRSVAVDGDIAAVGAYQKDKTGTEQGSAYLFDLTTGNKLFTLVPSVEEDYSYFGTSIDVEGDYVIVGAPEEDAGGSLQGAVYVFNVNDGMEVYRLLPDDPEDFSQFGFTVAISGNYALVGAPLQDESGSDRGTVYVFDLTTGDQLGKLSPSVFDNEGYFGDSLAADGGIAVVGADYEDNGENEQGAAYLFDIATRTELFRITADDAGDEDHFGWSVGISGDQCIVGAPDEDSNGNESGAAYIFNVTTGEQIQKITPSDGDGNDLAGIGVAITDDFAYVGAEKKSAGTIVRGAAYVFYGTDLDPDLVTLRAKLIAKAKRLKKKANRYIEKDNRTRAKILRKRAKKLIRRAKSLY